MPADVPVTLTPWCDAKGNPPKDDKIVVTGSAYGYYDRGGWWQHYDDYGPDPMDPQPSVWCDPSPPDMSDPLTVDDLATAAAACEQLAKDSLEMRGPRWMGETAAAEWACRAARLRRALDAIGTP